MLSVSDGNVSFDVAKAYSSKIGKKISTSTIAISKDKILFHLQHLDRTFLTGFWIRLPLPCVVSAAVRGKDDFSDVGYLNVNFK